VDNSGAGGAGGADSALVIPEPFTFIRSDADLYAAWQGLMGEGGFAQSTLWLVFIDDQDRMQPLVMPIEPLPPEPDGRFVANLTRIVGDLHDTGELASVAVLLSRPGPPEMAAADRRWARALRDGLAGLSPWPVHLATRDRLVVFAPDDLIAA